MLDKCFTIDLYPYWCSTPLLDLLVFHSIKKDLGARALSCGVGASEVICSITMMALKWHFSNITVCADHLGLLCRCRF